MFVRGEYLLSSSSSKRMYAARRLNASITAPLFLDQLSLVEVLLLLAPVPTMSLGCLTSPPRRSICLYNTHKQMTVADLTVAHKIKYLKDGALEGIPATIADSYPNIIALYDNVVKQPKIAAFIAKHAK